MIGTLRLSYNLKVGCLIGQDNGNFPHILKGMKTEQDLKKIFGQNVKTRRERKGWTQEELSVKAGVTNNTISDIEKGDKFARAKTLVKLAIVLKTEVYELLKPDNVMPDKNADIIAKYGEEVREAVEKVGNFYIENAKK